MNRYKPVESQAETLGDLYVATKRNTEKPEVDLARNSISAGTTDQYRREVHAASVALGLDPYSDYVSPQDIGSRAQRLRWAIESE